MPLIENMRCEICGAAEGTVGECIEFNHIGQAIAVQDSELGRRGGVIKGANHEGHAMVSFLEEPAVVVFPEMIIRGPNDSEDGMEGCESVLAQNNWSLIGGGNNFSLWAANAPPGQIYLYQLNGRGPDDSHWVRVDDDVHITAGGFTAESLEAHLKTEGRK